MTTGSTDLAAMLATLDVTTRPDAYVFAVVHQGHPAIALAEATIKEPEGLTIVLLQNDADLHDLSYDLVASWLTLTVHSSLESVGLTAAFSRILSAAGISCNVLAGYYHDHLLVPTADLSQALVALQRLREE
jgi:hypothetical protein